jgi:hypothetical protein
MSQQPRRGAPGSGSGEFARSAGFAAARGFALIAIAVAIGVVLLQVVDDGTSGPADAGSEPTTETSAGPSSSATTTTTAAAQEPARSPEEIRVLVLNGGAPSGSAKNVSDVLKGVGYVNQPVDPTDDDETRDGNAVMCRTGFDQEASMLALAVGTSTEIVPFRDPPPPSSDQADCVVIVGTPVSAGTTTPAT